MLWKTTIVTVLLAFAVVLVSAAIAVAVNAVRPEGIPLIAKVPYDIFAPCKDSDAQSQAASTSDLAATAGNSILYVDARPAEAFSKEHVRGAINVAYSALFGATESDLNMVKRTILTRKATSVVVYGVFSDPSAPDQKVDFGKPLAEQLIEAGIAEVRHIEGGLETLKKNGIATVQKQGKDQ